MNRERITLLREHLADLSDERFNIRFWFTDHHGGAHDIMWTAPEYSAKDVTSECGTAACIAGWTLSLFDATVPGEDDEGVVKVAGELLGLDRYEAGALFMPPGFSDGRYTRQQAIDTLDRLLETGEVRW